MEKAFINRGYYEELSQVVRVQILLLMVTTLILYIIYSGNFLTRLMRGYFYCIDLVLMYGGRQFLKHYLFQRFWYGKRSKRMLVITDSEQVEEQIINLKKYMSWDFRTTWIVVLDQDRTRTRFLEAPVVWNM